MKMESETGFWCKFGALGLLILAINIAALAGCVWIVVKVLQWTGVIG